jgi:hypothetical protein
MTWKSAVAGVVLVLTLASCSSTDDLIEQKKGNPKVVMTPEEARAEVHTLLESASNVLGGNWYIEETALPDQCSINSQDDGVYWSGGRRQEDLTDIDGPTDRMFRYWQAQGFPLKTGSFAPEHRAIAATTPSGATLHYKFDSEAIVISVEGACVIGDRLKIEDEIVKTLPDPYEEYYGTATPTPDTTADTYTEKPE